MNENTTGLKIDANSVKFVDVETNEVIMEVKGMSNNDINKLVNSDFDSIKEKAVELKSNTENSFDNVKTLIEGLSEYYKAKQKLTLGVFNSPLHKYLDPVTSDIQYFVIEVLNANYQYLSSEQLLELYRIANNLSVKAEIKKLLIRSL